MKTPTDTQDPARAARALEDAAWRALQQRNAREALRACRQLNRDFPDYAKGWHSSSQIALRLKQPGAALAAAEQLLRLQPRHPAALLQKALCLMHAGRAVEASPLLDMLSGKPLATAYQHSTLALLLSRQDRQEQALSHYSSAASLEPDNPEHHYNQATIHRFLGDTQAAEAALSRTLALRPLDADAHKLRADLRRQSQESNHLSALQVAIKESAKQPRSLVKLHYALGKELEDLERWPEAFDAIARGAHLRRRLMRYDVKADIAVMQQICETFNESRLREIAPGNPDWRPIFVLGMPRTGTTVVERILGSHSQVHAAGELTQFAQCLSEAVARQAPPAGKDASADPAPGKRERVAASADLDFWLLGEAYIRAVPAQARSAGRFVDKMPLNFLYLGLIHRALPGATFIHVRRKPADACFAMYKTLFADAYPFSYQLEELADYYLAYHRLMEHWQDVLPGSIHAVDYEALVSDFPATCRRLLDACELPFEAQCLDFHRSRQASTTASASQVREPVHSRSVGRWRHFEHQLKPLLEKLRAGGLEP